MASKRLTPSCSRKPTRRSTDRRQTVITGVIYEDEHYRVSDASFQKICEEYFGITIENKAKFGSTITKGESVFDRNLDMIRETKSEYVVLEFGGNDCGALRSAGTSRLRDARGFS